MLLLILTMVSAFADIRVMNATGEPLLIDVEGDSTAIHDHALPPDHTFSETLGDPLPDNSYETLIVKDATGKVLKRERVVNRSNYVVVRWGSGVSVRAAGNFRGKSASQNRVGLINATGERLTYRLAYADEQVAEGQTRELRTPEEVTYAAFGQHAPPGTEVALQVQTAEASPTRAKVKTGGLYMVTKAAGGLVVTEMYVP